MEVVCSSQMLEPTYHTAWCHRSGSYSVDLHGHKNILYFLMFISQVSLNSTTVYGVSFIEFIEQTAGLG